MKLDESSLYRLAALMAWIMQKVDAQTRVNRGHAGCAANGGSAAFDNGVVCVPGLRCASERNGTGAVFISCSAMNRRGTGMDESIVHERRAAYTTWSPLDGGACSVHRRRVR